MTSPHAKAVLFVCEYLTGSGHTVISANTDEQYDPQIFSQSETGELAFYFVRENQPAPTPADRDRFLALTAKHDVAAYYAAVKQGNPAPSVTVSSL